MRRCCLCRMRRQSALAPRSTASNTGRLPAPTAAAAGLDTSLPEAVCPCCCCRCCWMAASTKPAPAGSLMLAAHPRAACKPTCLHEGIALHRDKQPTAGRGMSGRQRAGGQAGSQAARQAQVGTADDYVGCTVSREPHVGCWSGQHCTPVMLSSLHSGPAAAVGQARRAC